MGTDGEGEEQPRNWVELLARNRVSAHTRAQRGTRRNLVAQHMPVYLLQWPNQEIKRLSDNNRTCDAFPGNRTGEAATASTGNIIFILDYRWLAFSCVIYSDERRL